MKNKKYIIATILLILFVLNTILVVANAYNAVDLAVRDFLMNFYSATTDKIMQIFTFLGSTTWIILLSLVIFLFFLLYEKKTNFAFATAVVIIASTILNQITKFIIQRPRPFYMPEGLESSYSYPSGHTMASASLYGFIIYLICKTNISRGNKIFFSSLLAVVILMVMTSRIYLGAHYFSDVVGGLLFSGLLLITLSIIEDKKKYLYNHSSAKEIKKPQKNKA